MTTIYKTQDHKFNSFPSDFNNVENTYTPFSYQIRKQNNLFDFQHCWNLTKIAASRFLLKIWWKQRKKLKLGWYCPRKNLLNSVENTPNQRALGWRLRRALFYMKIVEVESFFKWGSILLETCFDLSIDRSHYWKVHPKGFSLLIDSNWNASIPIISSRPICPRTTSCIFAFEFWSLKSTGTVRLKNTFRMILAQIENFRKRTYRSHRSVSTILTLQAKNRRFALNVDYHS